MSLARASVWTASSTLVKIVAGLLVVKLLAVSFGARALANLVFARPLVADARLYSLVTDTAWIMW